MYYLTRCEVQSGVDGNIFALNVTIGSTVSDHLFREMKTE